MMMIARIGRAGVVPRSIDDVTMSWTPPLCGVTISTHHKIIQVFQDLIVEQAQMHLDKYR